MGAVLCVTTQVTQHKSLSFHEHGRAETYHLPTCTPRDQLNGSQKMHRHERTGAQEDLSPLHLTAAQQQNRVPSTQKCT